MNEEYEEFKVIFLDAFDTADRYYAEIVAEMRKAYVNALRDGVDYEFDEKLLGKFERAIEDLAVASVFATAEGFPLPVGVSSEKK